MSDREAAQEICNLTHHDWQEGYYGWRCETCGEFIPYGCEPWLPIDDYDGEYCEDDDMDGAL